MNKILRAALAALAIAACLPAGAGAGDDHGHDHGPAAATGEASPRFEAHSDLFELVGVAEKGQLTVYLDRYATNEPIVGARIEYESGTRKGVAAAQPDGTYAIRFESLDRPGQFPFSFTVSAGSDTDLLAGDLVIADANAGAEAPTRTWRWWLGIGAAGLAALALLAFAARKLAARRPGRHAA